MYDVVIRIADRTRLIVNAQGGLDVESFVPNVGWVLDNDNEHVTDIECRSTLADAMNSLNKAWEKIPSPSDQAAFRIDFRAWLKRLGDRKKRIPEVNEGLDGLIADEFDDGIDGCV